MRWTQAELDAYEARSRTSKGKTLCEVFEAEAYEDEDKLHYDIMDACKHRGWPFVRSRPDRPTGQIAGVPDFIIATNLPDPMRKTLWVECKSRKGKQSPEQRGFEMALSMNNHNYHLVRSLSEFLSIIASPSAPGQPGHD